MTRFVFTFTSIFLISFSILGQQATVKNYTQELTAFNVEDSVELSGTLTLPSNDGKKYPVVILVSGSGPQNRDSEILGHKSFLVIANYLAKNGIGSFRYDDRGVDKSTGDFAKSDLNDFYRDLEAVAQLISERKEISKLGILGHSEGGILAPKFAANNKKLVDFVIMMGAPGMPITDMMHEQRTILYEAMGMSKEVIDEQKELFTEIDKIVMNNSGKDKTVLLDAHLTNYLRMKGITGEALETQKKQVVAQVNSAWYKSFVETNPSDYLTKVRCSVLVLAGGKDTQVPMKANVEAISKALSQSKSRFLKKRTIQISRFNNLNHLMQPAKTGMPNEYKEIETTIDESVLESIANFINNL